MKKLLPSFFFFFSAISTQAQVVSDTVQQGAGYVNQAFYQLSYQTKTHAAFSGANGWDIGFQTTLMNASIICDDNTIEVYKVPNADSTDYATLDVSGYASWSRLYNSDTTWDIGAFNTGEDISTFDFGWGVYDFNTHEVYGDSLFALVKNGDVYKFWIRKKTSTGDYLIRYTNVTAGGSDIDVTIPAAGYSTKNFVYLNLDYPTSVLDFEPASASWDILFTHYLTYVPYAGYYPVTGVFSNAGVTVAKAYPIDTGTVSYTNYLSSLATNLTAIGYDWKIFIQPYGPYEIEDSLIYFIKAKDNYIYSLLFTEFDMNTGTSSFQTENLGTGINDAGGPISQTVVYPNPSSEHVTIVYDAKSNVRMNTKLFDIAGREVMLSSFDAHQGLNSETLLLPVLTNGVYQLVLNAGEQKINLKVMVAQ